MAKLSSLQLTTRAEVGATMIVRDFLAKPDDKGQLPPLLARDGTPCTITFMGIDSPVARRLRHERRAASRNAMLAAMYTKAESGGELQVATADAEAEAEQHSVAELVGLTLAWHGFEDDDDVPLPCTPEHTEALFAQCDPIREQASRFIYDRADFFGASASGSAPLSPTS